MDFLQKLITLSDQRFSISDVEVRWLLPAFLEAAQFDREHPAVLCDLAQWLPILFARQAAQSPPGNKIALVSSCRLM
jgi:hypothetical protein